MKGVLSCIFLILFMLSVRGQTTKKVLFIGNSYTAANDLPFMISRMASSTDDILVYDSNTPGGFRLMDHASNATTLSKINAENWDYVVLQAQSQETALDEPQMEAELYPFAESLGNVIRANNSCSQPMFYMTWGRENGDPNLCPYLQWVCTYEGMDDAISTTYVFMSETNETELSPVGGVWRYIRENYPSIDLYDADESHPTIAGSYAAACTFYTMIYKKDPNEIGWNSTLSEEKATIIKDAAKMIVFDSISDWNFTQDPIANFSESINGGEVSFANTSSDFDLVFWDFGDSDSSTETDPIHIYNESGSYDVSLTVSKCDKVDTITKTLDIDIRLGVVNLHSGIIAIYPNPASSILNIELNKIYHETSITLVDLSGKVLIKKTTSNPTKTTLDVSNLSSGIYILKVIADQTLHNKKIFKNKKQLVPYIDKSIKPRITQTCHPQADIHGYLRNSKIILMV